jgi:hypothetical protein
MVQLRVQEASKGRNQQLTKAKFGNVTPKNGMSLLAKAKAAKP